VRHCPPAGGLQETGADMKKLTRRAFRTQAVAAGRR
jgi:hypothetical protein